MSLPPGVSAPRSLAEQAQALVEFLAVHAHALGASEAATALSGLDSDAKLAAKELRVRLRAHGVDIKHTHALKAVAVVRGTLGVLGLASQERWALYSWSPEAPAISAQPARFNSIRAAADELCRRIRSEFEGANPSVDLTLSRTAFRLHATSLATGAPWKTILVRQDGAGQALEIPFLEAKHLAERVRRLAEGEMHGWVGGIYALEHVYGAEVGAVEPDSVMLLSHDGLLVDEVMKAAGVVRAEDLPEVMPRLSTWRDQPALSQEAWAALRKRCILFYEKHGQLPEDWSVDQLATPDFNGTPINLKLVKARCEYLGLSFARLEMKAGTGGNIEDALSRGQLNLSDMAGVARVLGLDGPNSLLVKTGSAPRIPLKTSRELAIWLSRMDKLDVDVGEAAPAASHSLQVGLRTQCAIPFEQRRRWGAAAPPALEELQAQLANAKLVACARVEIRFVKDLPVDEWRPTTLCVMSLEREIDVLTQNGKLPPSPVEAVTPEWLERFNEPDFTGDELMRYSSRAQEIANKDDAAGERDNFYAQVAAGQEVFGRDHVRINSATLRMEALSMLMKSHPLEPWVRRSTDGDGVLMIQEAAFEATAQCELVDVGGRPGFDAQTFYLLCASYDPMAA